MNTKSTYDCKHFWFSFALCQREQFGIWIRSILSIDHQSRNCLYFHCCCLRLSHRYQKSVWCRKYCMIPERKQFFQCYIRALVLTKLLLIKEKERRFWCCATSESAESTRYVRTEGWKSGHWYPNPSFALVPLLDWFLRHLLWRTYHVTIVQPIIETLFLSIQFITFADPINFFRSQWSHFFVDVMSKRTELWVGARTQCENHVPAGEREKGRLRMMEHGFWAIKCRQRSLEYNI